MTTTIVPALIKTGVYNSRSASANAIDSGKPRFKTGVFTSADTTDAGDTVSIDVYAEFGITKVLTIQAFVHTTTDSVMTEETLVTTAVTGTTLTVTVPVGTDNDKRVFVVRGI